MNFPGGPTHGRARRARHGRSPILTGVVLVDARDIVVGDVLADGGHVERIRRALPRGAALFETDRGTRYVAAGAAVDVCAEVVE